jgi:hypothetical protein
MIPLLSKIKLKIDEHKQREIIYLIPLTLCCLLFYFQSLSFHIHDYGVSYYPARMVVEGGYPESVVFDIHQFNEYIWAKGHTEEISDYYLNSPFLSTLFYPLALIDNVLLSKAVFNGVSILLFLLALFRLSKMYLKEQSFLLVFLPVLFFLPLRNHILFGQNYMLVFTLVSFAFIAFERGKSILGGGLVSIAILVKIFPVFYVIALAFQRKWKAAFITAGIGALILLVSWVISGPEFWQVYLFEVLPDAIASESTSDFRSNAQSLDVFFRTLLVWDSYYNPEAFADYPQLYKALVGLCKAIILGFTLRASFLYRNDLFRLLAVWVAALFLIQTRTGSYAQILWIIPLIEVFRSTVSVRVKVLFLSLLLVISNFPFPVLISAPILITFSRLWLSILLVFLFWYSLQLRFNLKFIGLGVLIMLPLTVKGALTGFSEEPGAEYVLDKKQHFMIYDFNEVNGTLHFGAIGGKGDVEVETGIRVDTFEPEACSIRDGQVYLGEQQLTKGLALKKNPVLVNGCEVYYLSDRLSRRAAFTLKKMNVCEEGQRHE